MVRYKPGQVRDSILAILEEHGGEARVDDVLEGVQRRLGAVAPSSVRSYLRLNTGHDHALFERRSRGVYAVRVPEVSTLPLPLHSEPENPTFADGQDRRMFNFGRQTLMLDDCLQWLETAEPNSIHAVVTDPPYGLVEYNPEQQRKMREGRGGRWRLPPAFDGANRMPLPRFTVLSSEERGAILGFFTSWGRALLPALRPGAHVFIAGNPLVSPLVAYAMESAGFERRGEIVRLVRTFRGGDRPKGAHLEFSSISTMPRSCWEPWGLYRKPLDCPTVAQNLRRWGTGGLKRLSPETPLLDVIPSGLTPARERAVAPHPSVKPQAFLRQIVRAALPLGEGTVLDTFAGCATTLAACEAVGVTGVGVEIDPCYWEMARAAIPKLAALRS